MSDAAEDGDGAEGRLIRALDAAIECFGAGEGAARWLITPNAVLGWGSAVGGGERERGGVSARLRRSQGDARSGESAGLVPKKVHHFELDSSRERPWDAYEHTLSLSYMCLMSAGSRLARPDVDS